MRIETRLITKNSWHILAYKNRNKDLQTKILRFRVLIFKLASGCRSKLHEILNRPNLLSIF